MGLDLDYQDGQTPLDGDEKEGLRIKGVTTRGELDEFEQLNIQKAVEEYLIRRNFPKDMILSEQFILRLHRKMLGDVWSWSGTFRRTNKNIGVDKVQIPMRLRQLIENCRYWIDHQIFPADEIAIRFKHELVSIHLFPNGNGRHSRMMGDIIAKNIFKNEPFSWGARNLTAQSDIRSDYIQALRKADRGDFEDLIQFARS